MVEVVCEWCQQTFERLAARHGPEPRFCSPAHRQAAARARKIDAAERAAPLHHFDRAIFELAVSGQ